MLEHLKGSDGRIAVQQDDVTRLEIHKVQIPFYIESENTNSAGCPQKIIEPCKYEIYTVLSVFISDRSSISYFF